MADPTFLFPAEGVTLDGSVQLFRWDLGGIPIESAWLYVGAAQGGSQYAARFVGTETDSSTGELPTDGSAVFGRLWYRTAGAWNFIDRRWVAAAEPGLPELLDPAAGSTLAGPTDTFRWTFDPQQVESSWLYLGSEAGGSDLAAVPTGTDVEATVSGLPLDERVVHARLYYLLGGLWYFVDEQYRAGLDAGPTRDELIRELQTLVGVQADGDIGPVTRSALNRNWVARVDSFDPSFAERFANDGDVVTWVQQRLVARGVDLVVDGDAGPATEAALVAELGRGGVVAAESFELLVDPAV